jgi:cell division septum initiation protein DivIVA
MAEVERLQQEIDSLKNEKATYEMMVDNLGIRYQNQRINTKKVIQIKNTIKPLIILTIKKSKNLNHIKLTGFP